MRAIGRSLMGVFSLLGLAGCGDRDDAAAAALKLAEALYPGQFALHDTYQQKDHFDVALVMKGDPLTRVRFAVDRDPAACGVGSPCEQRLRRAYDNGIATGIKLKALNASFPACGVPLLGTEDAGITPAFVAIVELDLDPADQQPALDRLTPCIAAFRQALGTAAGPVEQTLKLRILRPAPNKPAEAGPLTLDTHLSAGRQNEPSYLTAIMPNEAGVAASALRLNPHYVRGSGLREALVAAAQGALVRDPRGGHVPGISAPWGLKLDPQRLDVIHTYMLACSVQTPGKGPCRTDIAVRLRYDLGRGEASEFAVIRDIRDARGAVALPALPGR